MDSLEKHGFHLNILTVYFVLFVCVMRPKGQDFRNSEHWERYILASEKSANLFFSCYCFIFVTFIITLGKPPNTMQ